VEQICLPPTREVGKRERDVRSGGDTQPNQRDLRGLAPFSAEPPLEHERRQHQYREQFQCAADSEPRRGPQ
jgi:hypothetical protein